MTDYECRPKFGLECLSLFPVNSSNVNSAKSETTCIINDLTHLEIYDAYLAASRCPAAFVLASRFDIPAVPNTPS